LGGSATTCSSPKQHQKEEKQALRPLLILVATNARPSRQLTPISEMNRSFNFLALVLAAACMLGDTEAFAPRPVTASSRNPVSLQACRKIKDDDVPNPEFTANQRKKLGLPDDADEHDLGVAPENNADPFISKVVAGSLMLAILGLLVAGVIIPATTDYGEGVCNTILTGGRC
jgi:hypothetical protein